jgi:hypothetical protein
MFGQLENALDLFLPLFGLTMLGEMLYMRLIGIIL